MTDRLGLDDETRRVYSTLLDAQDTSNGLVARVEADPASVERALDHLSRLGLINVDDDGVVTAVPPRVGFAQRIAEAETEVAQRQTEIARARRELAALAAEHDATRDRESVIRLTSLEAVRDRLAELSLEAHTECASFNPGRAHRPDAMDASKPLNQRALERGVAIRCVYQESFRNDPATLDYARWLTALGGEARTMPVVPMNLVIVDRQVALIPYDPDDHRAGALEIRNPAMVLAVCSLFDQVWPDADVFGELRVKDPDVPTPQERQLLRLLADGHTDESAARRLEVSVRTVRRIMSDLSARLGAGSRFEAGVRANERGWV